MVTSELWSLLNKTVIIHCIYYMYYMLRQILLAPHVSTYIFGNTFSVYIIGITFYGLYYIIGIISYGLYYWYHIYGVHYWHHMSQHYYWYYFFNEYYWHYMLWTILEFFLYGDTPTSKVDYYTSTITPLCSKWT